MPRITQSDILHSFHGIREHFHDFVYLSRITEIIISFMPEGLPNQKLFLFFLYLLNMLESSVQIQKDSFYLISQIRLLSLLGYAPRLQGCGRCSARSLHFYPNSGTTLCRQCAANFPVEKETPVKITNKAIHFYSHCIGWPIKITSRRLKPSKETLSELSSLLDIHLTHLLHKKLLTSAFIAGM